MGTLQISTPFGHVVIIDVPTYTSPSGEKVRSYPVRIHLGGGDALSGYGILIDSVRRLVVTASGTSEVGSRSAVVWHDCLLLAIDCHVACLSLPSMEVRWAIEADTATCFGLYVSDAHDALICRGELCVTRLSLDGEIVWQEGGRDIFTDDFDLDPNYISAKDFDGHLYLFDYSTGAEISTPQEG